MAHLDEDLGHNSEAEVAFKKAAAVRPDDWTGHNNLGIFYAHRGRYREATQEYRTALKLTPDNSAVFVNLGSAYLNAGEKLQPEAEMAFRRSIEINPTYAAYANLGNLYALEHRFPDAIDATRKALEMNDQNYEVWNNLGEAYEWAGQFAEAKAAREKAIQLLQRRIDQNAEDGQAQALLAALLAKDRHRAAAVDRIRTALALSPKDWYVLGEAADVYEMLGNRREAIKWLELALQHGFPVGQLGADVNLVRLVNDPRFHAPVKPGG
jgi:serine/threonine-protein kinase